MVQVGTDFTEPKGTLACRLFLLSGNMFNTHLTYQ